MIKRSKHSQNYTVIPNEIFKDVNDCLAIGLLSYLLSKPANWTVTKQQLYNHFTQGRRSIDKSFKLLEDKGYIEGRQSFDDNKKFMGWSWTVFDTPTISRLMENRQPINRQSTKRQPINRQLLSKELISTELISKEDSNIDFDSLLKYFNELFKKNSRIVIDKARKQFVSRIKEGFTKDDILRAMKNAHSNSYHIETNYSYCTLEFFSRADKLDKYSSIEPKKEQPTKYIPTK